jgi:hypothetical protein
MFKDTTYTVCSFYFYKEINQAQDIDFEFIGKKEGKIILNFSKDNDYSIRNNFLKELKKFPAKIKIGRITKETNNKPTNIFLNCIDTSSPIKTEIKEPFYGIKTDRAFLTFFIEGVEISIEEEKLIVEKFNKKLDI